MPIDSLILAIDGEDTVRSLEAALEALEDAGGEIVLDFSSVTRVDARALRIMEQLAGRAAGKAVRIVLAAVPISVYRVMKLMRLAPRFVFQT